MWLSHSLLNDPAFSPDPRSHPHFPLAHASNYKALPPKCSSHATPDIENLPVLAPPRNRAVPRRGKMSALVRRLTTRHKLDRIDELDETDPFGGPYHHDGPYEAITSNLAHDIHHSKRQSNPLPLRRPHHSTSRGPSILGDAGLSLHLKPGQILQQNTVYTSYASRVPSIPTHLIQAALRTRPEHSRTRSLPNPRIHSPADNSFLDLHDFQSQQPSSSLHPPQQLYSLVKPSDIPLTFAHQRGLHSASKVRYQTETVILPPPRYESRFHNPAFPQSPQCTPPPSIHLAASQKLQFTENTVSAFPPSSKHKGVRSLDMSDTWNGAVAQTSSSTDSQPLEPSRMHHLPKRLVMPAPLHPQPQPQHEPPRVRTANLQSGHYALEAGQSAMYTQKPRVLRKRSSISSVKMPIPVNVSMSQDDPLIRARSPTKTVSDAQGTKERTRRRRLSKRKDDI